MIYMLNDKIKKFTPYSPAGEIDLSKIEIRLDANESFANLPDYITEDISNNIKKTEFNRYPDPVAAALTRKYSEYLKTSEGADVNAENIAVGTGADELLSITINAFLSKGDKLLTFTPDFSMYAFYGEVIEADVIKVKKDGENNFAIDFEAMAEKIKRENVKLAVFSNPCNPTGRLESKEALIKFLRAVNIPVIVDEVYMSFAGDKKNQSFLYDFSEYPNLIIMKSLSKAVGLAAARVGFAISNEVFINTIKTIKSPFNVNAVSQKIAEIVLGYPDYLAERLAAIKENKKNLQTAVKMLLAGKKDYKVYDTETNFLLVETDRANEIFNFLLEHKILIRNVENRFLRITSGSAEENGKLVGRLGEFLN